MPLAPEIRRQISLQTLRDFAAELEASLASGTLDEVGRQSCEYHLRVARDSIAALEQQLPKANRPARQFADEQQVYTPDERTGTVLYADPPDTDWRDGEWTYEVEFPYSNKLVRYAEHELTEAGR